MYPYLIMFIFICIYIYMYMLMYCFYTHMFIYIYIYQKRISRCVYGPYIYHLLTPCYWCARIFPSPHSWRVPPTNTGHVPTTGISPLSTCRMPSWTATAPGWKICWKIPYARGDFVKNIPTFWGGKWGKGFLLILSQKRRTDLFFWWNVCLSPI